MISRPIVISTFLVGVMLRDNVVTWCCSELLRSMDMETWVGSLRLRIIPSSVSTRKFSLMFCWKLTWVHAVTVAARGRLISTAEVCLQIKYCKESEGQGNRSWLQQATPNSFRLQASGFTNRMLNARTFSIFLGRKTQFLRQDLSLPMNERERTLEITAGHCGV